MRTWWTEFWARFWTDKAFFVSVVRSLVMTLGAGGLAYADQVAALFGGDALAVKVIRGVAVVAMGLALFFRAGEKNEDDVQLRARLERMGLQLPPTPPDGGGA